MPSNQDFVPGLSSDARVFLRDDSETYIAHAYQYSTTSHQKGDMEPAAVIYPTNVDDVIAAVKYAKDKKVGLAVRTGGHQYSGASSTSQDNIQLDMSEAFKSEDDFVYDAEQNLLHSGISFSLKELNDRLRERDLFLPHGQCLHVHLGGHVQSGGYGQLTRAFGLLSDHVEGFDIVLASGDHVTVWKPDSDIVDKHQAAKPKHLNDDLYWAVLGGSPGNYGILTHVWLRPHKDEDHPDSRGMKLFALYSKEKLDKVLTVLAEMNDDKDLPQDFDVCCTVMSDSLSAHFLRNYFDWKPKYDNLDEKMLCKYPKEYADGVDYAEKGIMSIPCLPCAAILVYLQWANVKGAAENFGEKQKVWFKRIREATCPNITDEVVEDVCDGVAAPFFSKIKELVGDGEVRNWLYVSEDEHTPMSKLTRYWCYEDIREYVKPYDKRAYTSNKYNLSTNGWTAWVSERIDQIASREDPDTNVVVQIQPYGGNNSMFHRNGDPGLHHGCHSWRQEISMLAVLDCFYQPASENVHRDKRLNRVQQWQAENDSSAQKGGIFSSVDWRFLWGSYARHTDPDAGANLHSVREKYFDSEEKYEKLVAIKRKVDPGYIFTANMFGVDANNAPKDRQLKVVGRGYEMDASPDSDCSAASSSQLPISGSSTGPSIFKLIFLPNCCTQLE